MHDPLSIYHAIVAAALAFAFIGMLVNLTIIRSPSGPGNPPAPGKPGTTAAKVSVLVPARNESARLETCLRSLLEQDYPNIEIILLDDCSTDDTPGIARALGFSEDNPRRRLMRGTPLPNGWVGKCWACEQLSSAATGEYLLFTDADTRHAKHSVSAAVGVAAATGSDLLTVWPNLTTLTWSERLVIPLIPLLATATLPLALLDFLQKHPALARLFPRPILRSLGAANGQFLLFRATAYRTIGGHRSVKDHLVEDIGLAREITARTGDGLKLITVDGSRMVNCRMYTRFAELWEGFTKNLRPAFENALGIFLLTGVVQFCCFFLPFVLLFVPGQPRPIIALQIAIIYLIRIVLAARLRTSWLGCALHPVGHALAMIIALNSWRRSSGPGVTWKGRTYLPGNGAGQP